MPCKGKGKKFKQLFTCCSSNAATDSDEELPESSRCQTECDVVTEVQVPSIAVEDVPLNPKVEEATIEDHADGDNIPLKIETVLVEIHKNDPSEIEAAECEDMINLPVIVVTMDDYEQTDYIDENDEEIQKVTDEMKELGAEFVELAEKSPLVKVFEAGENMDLICTPGLGEEGLEVSVDGLMENEMLKLEEPECTEEGVVEDDVTPTGDDSFSETTEDEIVEDMVEYVIEEALSNVSLNTPITNASQLTKHIASPLLYKSSVSGSNMIWGRPEVNNSTTISPSKLNSNMPVPSCGAPSSVDDLSSNNDGNSVSSPASLVWDGYIPAEDVKSDEECFEPV